MVEGREDQPRFVGEQIGQLLIVGVGHDRGTGTTAPVVALTLAASSAVAVATASWAFTGGGLRPRTALANAG